MDNFEYHTHLEGGAEPQSWRRLFAGGRDAGPRRRPSAPRAGGAGLRGAQDRPRDRGEIPADCTLVIAASPRTTFLPARAWRCALICSDGGSALFLFDLGFVLEPGLARLIADLGIRPEQEVVIDPLSHYSTDPEMVAVTGYDPHPVTRRVSLTFYPGIRPL